MSQPSIPASSILGNRRTLLVLTCAGCAHLALTAAGLPGWECPVRGAFGFPCPGCGLTRATLKLLGGDWRQALSIHAFAPVVVLILGGLVVTAVLPPAPRMRLNATLVHLDSRFRLSWLLLFAFLIYWIERFFLDDTAFRQLAA